MREEKRTRQPGPAACPRRCCFCTGRDRSSRCWPMPTANREKKRIPALSVRGEAQCLIVALHPDVRLVGNPLVHGHHNDNSAGACEWRAAVAVRNGSSVDVMALDDAPLAARTPILDEIVVGIARVAVFMLLPIRIMHPDAVSLLEILLLQCVEESVDHAFLRPESEQPPQDGNNNQDSYRKKNHVALLASACRIVSRRFEQGHANTVYFPLADGKKSRCGSATRATEAARVLFRFAERLQAFIRQLGHAAGRRFFLHLLVDMTCIVGARH